MKKDVVALIVVMVLVLAVSAEAGTLRLGTPTVEGNQVSFPLLLEGDNGDGVASMNFRMRYDPDVLEPVSAERSASAQAVNKTVATNLVEPGEYAVVIMGMNDAVLTEGQIATINMQRVGGSTSEQTNVRITRTTFAAPDASEIPSRGASTEVKFTEPSTTEQGADASGTNESAQAGGTPGINAIDIAAIEATRNPAATTQVPGTTPVAPGVARPVRPTQRPASETEAAPTGSEPSEEKAAPKIEVTIQDASQTAEALKSGDASAAPDETKKADREEKTPESTTANGAEAQRQPIPIVVGVIAVAIIVLFLIRKKLFG